ncbi:MAG: hypothetical protein R2867_37885 [Caldilineaceae bacterium]
MVSSASGFVWKNAAGETLGGGFADSLDALPVGTNVITLVVTNSVGESAETTVTVIVDDDLSLPGPTLTAGPAPVSWHVAAESTTAQTAQISINNAGSGELTWSAASDQPWLTLDVLTGTVTADGDPLLLTITADPSGLATDQSHAAQVTGDDQWIGSGQSIIMHQPRYRRCLESARGGGAAGWRIEDLLAGGPTLA